MSGEGAAHAHLLLHLAACPRRSPLQPTRRPATSASAASTKVRVDGPFKVTLATGVAPFAKASGAPAALDRVAIDVQRRTLVVHTSTSSWGGYPGDDAGTG